ncbi:MAG TPA: hypothetical protein VGH28_13880 [Polyangiaceae bacterium]|jgi:hypothetical protein
MTSPIRANTDLKNALIKRYFVAASQTITAGTRVKFSSTTVAPYAGVLGQEVTPSTSDEDVSIGVALETAGSGSVAAGTTLVDIALDGFAILPYTVGSGGSTAGKKQVWSSTGCTDAPANGGGTTAHTVIGTAMQTGVQNDQIGVLVGGSSRGVSAT